MPAEPQRFDPERILAALERHWVDYVMVGGFASQLHGARRQTYDIAFVPDANPGITSCHGWADTGWRSGRTGGDSRWLYAMARGSIWSRVPESLSRSTSSS